MKVLHLVFDLVKSIAVKRKNGTDQFSTSSLLSSGISWVLIYYSLDAYEKTCQVIEEVRECNPDPFIYILFIIGVGIYCYNLWQYKKPEKN